MAESGKYTIGLAPYYNAVLAGRGFALAPHHYPIVGGLEDDRIENLLFLGPPGTGKSVLLSTVYPTWRLGHDPTTTILSVSAGEKLPATFMQASMQIFQHNKVYRELFPAVYPDQKTGWSLERGLFVTGHHPEDENASYMACGLSSKALTGLHCREMILDDIHDKENAGTPSARERVKEIYYNTLMGRADPRGVRRVAAGRWWARDDIYQEWIESGDWVVLELPAARPGQSRLWYDVYVPHGMDCIYSETLTKDTIQERGAHYTKYRAYYAAIDKEKKGFYWPDSKSKRKEYFTIERRQPRTAAVNYCGDMTGGIGAVFDEQDFTAYIPPNGIEFGIAHADVRRWCDDMKGEIEDAWDTALGQIQSESRTVGLTGLLVPCNHWHNNEDAQILGVCDFHYDVYLLDIVVKDIDFGQLARLFRERFAFWHPKRMNIEEKQSGVGLLQVMKGAQLPVYPIKVVEGKLERAVNSVLADEKALGGGAASVQGWAKMGRVFVPMGAKWVPNFLAKVCEFKGGSKASDEFDALVHLITRAILRSRKTGRIGSSDQNADAMSNLHPEDNRYAVLDQFGHLARQASNPMGEGIINPFSSFCGAPCHWFTIKHNSEWCNLHRKKTTALEGCSQWTNPGSAQARAIMDQRGPEEHYNG